MKLEDSPEHYLLWGIIRKATRTNPVSRKFCIREYNLFVSKDGAINEKSLSVLRDEIRDTFKMPLGSSQKGYFVINTEIDLKEVCDYYASKAVAILAVQKRLTENFMSFKGGQGRLV